jgi:hypothetical protein
MKISVWGIVLLVGMAGKGGYAERLPSPEEKMTRCWERLALTAEQIPQLIAADKSNFRWASFMKSVQPFLTPQQLNEEGRIHDNRGMLQALKQKGAIVEFPENEISVVCGFLYH